MKASKLEGTLAIFHVEADTLGCSRTLACTYVTKANSHKKEGSRCPRCNLGELEQRTHTVDCQEFAGVGKCGCETATMRLTPELVRMSPAMLASLTVTERDVLRCKHTKAARTELRKDTNLDALLVALQKESEDGP